MNSRRRIDLVWLGLLAATALTWALGESGLAGGAAGWPILVVLLLALAKGLAIALDFMELREAPVLWRGFVLGWLAAVVLVIVLVAIRPWG
jgi:hypothetical protein